jgi:hypothetical protein
MGYIPCTEDHDLLDIGLYIERNGDLIRVCNAEDFSPTTDMNAAYTVLEKIRSKMHTVEIHSVGLNEWEAIAEVSGGEYETLPLAISKLAEKILNTPEYMALFKGE